MIREVFCSRQIPLEIEPVRRRRDLERLVRKAGRFQCSVVIRMGAQEVDGKALAAVLAMDFGRDPVMVIEGWGIDARECLWALSEIAMKWMKRAHLRSPLEKLGLPLSHARKTALIRV